MPPPLLSALTVAGTAGEVLEQVDAADDELAATVQPTENELDTIIKKMDRIALTVTSSPNSFVHSNNHRHALLSEVVVAQPGIDKLKAVMEALTIEDDPEIQSLIVETAVQETKASLQTDTMDTSTDCDEDSDRDSDTEDSHDQDAAKIFSEDDLQMFEELSERFLATVRRYAPAAGAKHTGGLLNMLRAVKRGMEERKKVRQTSLNDYFSLKLYFSIQL